ncbi:MAG: hypothetical protein HQL95_16495 [Magnetococcales bacterium]|nr:hypothetical protein [Magnetococcales bacterium]
MMHPAGLSDTPPSRPNPRWLKRIITFPVMLLAALIVLFEELVWDKITDFVAWLARMRLVARLEGWIVTLGPYPTLALFAIPILTLLPLKILALYLITHDRVTLGVLVIVIAKVTGTAISARLFVIAKPKLMTFSLFVVVYNKALRFKNWAHELLAGWPLLAVVKRLAVALRARMSRLRSEGRSFVTSRLLAARRYFKGHP